MHTESSRWMRGAWISVTNTSRSIGLKGETLVGFDGSAPVIVQGYYSVSCRGILCEQDVKKRW